MWRSSGRKQAKIIERENFTGFLRGAQMSEMNRIECTAEYPNSLYRTKSGIHKYFTSCRLDCGGVTQVPKQPVQGLPGISAGAPLALPVNQGKGSERLTEF